jgi:ABC-type lipoprotein export system ATPase subunit
MNDLGTNSKSADTARSAEKDQAVIDPSTDVENDSNRETENKSFVCLENISRVYKSKHLSDNVTALDNVSLTMEPGERLALLGKSGSGKSTLLNLLGGLDRPTSGTIVVDDQEISALDSSQMASYRQRTVGMIFQAFNLITTKSAVKNVEMPFVFAGVSPALRRKKAIAALESVGLGERIKHRPTQLSGGEQQRVAIARAIANEPKLLLADEPTGNLDSATAQEIMQQLKAYSDEKCAAIILVTHDEELAHNFAHRIVRLRDGNIVGSE